MAITPKVGEAYARHFILTQQSALLDRRDAQESVDQVVCGDFTLLTVNKTVDVRAP